MITPQELAQAKASLARITKQPAPIAIKPEPPNLEKDIEAESVFERPAFDYRESMKTPTLKQLFKELKKLDRDEEQEARFNRIKTILNNRNIENIK